MVDPKNIALWTGALIGAGTVINGIIKFSFYLYDEIKKRISISAHNSEIPKESLRIALENANAY